MTDKNNLNVDEKSIQKVITMIKGKSISQVSITNGDSHISVKQKIGTPQLLSPNIIVNGDNKPKEEVFNDTPDKVKEEPVINNNKTVKSQYVGVVNFKNKKNTLAQIGQIVENNQTVALINSMKINNEVKTEFKGKIVKIFAEENSIVEYGTPILEIEPL
jgi:acetyl-CoA carboxylase biotin carboxyl carrier protein